MRKITDDLYETDEESPFPGLRVHAYLLTGRPGGNVLFYNTTLAREIDAFADLGGVAEHYLSHQDEVAPSLATVRERYGARLHASVHERSIVEARSPVDAPFGDVPFDGPGGVRVVPAPGHTPGSAFFVVDGAAGRYLFTGDSVFRGDDGSWHPGYIEGHSDRDVLDASLVAVARIDHVDVVVSSAFGGDSGATVLDGRPWSDVAAEARRRLPAHDAVAT